MNDRQRGRAEFSATLVVELIGSGAAALIAGRHWQTITAPNDLLHRSLEVTGRTVDSAPTALALVALAGVVAVLATRGIVRRAIGVVVALAGVGLIWRSAAAGSAISTSRARELLAQKGGVTNDSLVPHVQVHGGWSVLSILCGVLVVLAGAVIAGRGSRWAAMSARYESPSSQPRAVPADGNGTEDSTVAAPANVDVSMWTALDRGDDPTEHDPTDTA